MMLRVYQPTLLVLACALGVGCKDATAPVQGMTAAPALEALTPQSSQQIFIADADGSNPIHLTSGSNPSWSPDGRRIALSRLGFLHVIDANGSNLSRLRAGQRPSWSPDGSRLAFTDSSGIAVMDVNSNGATTVIRHDFNPITYKPWDMGVDKATWSPDGQRIAFEHLGDGDMEPPQVYVVNVDGSGILRLSRDPRARYSESDPSWSPDGRQIVHWSYGYGIAVTDVSVGTSRTLYANFPFVAYGAKPEWSPDGRFIVFNSFQWAGSKPQLFIVPADGGIVRHLSLDGHSADWSPDGSKIAFVRDVRWKQKR